MKRVYVLVMSCVVAGGIFSPCLHAGSDGSPKRGLYQAPVAQDRWNEEEGKQEAAQVVPAEQPLHHQIRVMSRHGWNSIREQRERELIAAFHAVQGVGVEGPFPPSLIHMVSSYDEPQVSVDNEGLVRFEAHRSPVLSVAVARNGEFIVSASLNTIILHNPNGRTRFKVQDKRIRGISSILITPDNRSLIISFINDPKIVVWDLIKGRTETVHNNHEGGITSLDITPNGRFLVTGSHDKTAQVWKFQPERSEQDLGSREAFFSDESEGIGYQSNLVRTFSGHEDTVRAVAMSRAGDFVVTGSDDGTARICPMDGMEPSKVLDGQANFVKAVAIDPEGRYILTASSDGMVRMWDSDGGVLGSFKAHEADIEGIASVLGGQIIITASQDGTIRVWDLNGVELMRFVVGNEITSLAVTADSKTIVVGCEDGQVWMFQALPREEDAKVKVKKNSYKSAKQVINGLWQDVKRKLSSRNSSPNASPSQTPLDPPNIGKGSDE